MCSFSGASPQRTRAARSSQIMVRATDPKGDYRTDVPTGVQDYTSGARQIPRRRQSTRWSAACPSSPYRRGRVFLPLPWLHPSSRVGHRALCRSMSRARARRRLLNNHGAVRAARPGRPRLSACSHDARRAGRRHAMLQRMRQGALQNAAGRPAGAFTESCLNGDSSRGTSKRPTSGRATACTSNSSRRAKSIEASRARGARINR